MSVPPYTPASRLLVELGVGQPDDIDIEAIAQYCGATVVYEPLTGCEARILGKADRAIITVNCESPIGRQRFSIGHELGHWMRDRGKIGFSCEEREMAIEWTSTSLERSANEYAADLLLPVEMFRSKSHAKPITFETVKDLARSFTSSLTATAIRLVRLGSFPAMLIFSEDGRRKWFIRGGDLPTSVWPLELPRLATAAADILAGAEKAGAIAIQADGWISDARAASYEIIEDSVRISERAILSLLWWKDERPLIEFYEE